MSTIRSVFEEYHTQNELLDKDQISVIFSNSKRLIVEAPAGYGKTKTMVSKIAYLIESNQIGSAKKILALTFSVNASFNIKKEILKQIESRYVYKEASRKINHFVETTNYHGFGRHILSKYGYLIHPNLAKINQFKIINEAVENDYRNLGLTQVEIDFLKNYAIELKEMGKPNTKTEEIDKYLLENREKYIRLLLEYFVPNCYLTFNGILLLSLELFEGFPNMKIFYQSYFPIIFVDEFQDTNWLQWKILLCLTGGMDLISTNRFLYLFGDRVQRIYGFIGAVPNIFDIARDLFEMDLIELKTNHRFQPDSKLGMLEKVLRSNAEDIRNPQIPFSVNLSVEEANSQKEVSEYVVKQVKNLLKIYTGSSIAILFRAGMNNLTTREVYKALKDAGISFYFALFNEDDQAYIDFHNNCLELWREGLKKGPRSFKASIAYLHREITSLPVNEINSSLSFLLNMLFEKIQKEYHFLSIDEKNLLISEVLENRSLKQHIGLVTDVQVILSTAHGAKGLEWDFVIMPDVQKFCFPPTPFCINYGCRECQIDWTQKSSEFEQAFLEELSIFYVAITRAKSDVNFVFSNKIEFRSGNIQTSPLSCLLRMPGLINKL